MATTNEVHRVWAVLLSAYPSWEKESSEEKLARTLTVYERLLRDIPGEALEAAALQLIAESKFFPTVAELRAKALSLLGPTFPSPMEAWGEVKRAISRHGRYQVPEFDNPITAKVVQGMGWLSLCDSENEAADRARFMQAYDTLCRREQEDALLLPEVRKLAESKRVALIGEKERIRSM
jgi:hypothetical protein